MRIDELRATLHERAEEVDDSDGVTVHARNEAVARRVHRVHSRRRAGVAATVALAAAAVVVGLIVVPPMLPDPAPDPVAPNPPMVEAPPRLAGYEMPEKLTVRKVLYRYQRGEQTHEDRDLLRVVVPSSPTRQVIGWSTSPGTPGQVVVSVDGTEVSRSRAGAFESGVLLEPSGPHLVVVRPTSPRPGGRIGFALYERDPYQ